MENHLCQNCRTLIIEKAAEYENIAEAFSIAEAGGLCFGGDREELIINLQNHLTWQSAFESGDNATKTAAFLAIGRAFEMLCRTAKT